MYVENEIIKAGKFLSMVLRHQPEALNIELDENGWTDVDILLKNMVEKGWKIDRQMLDFIVTNNSKKRYSYNEAKDKIRASQGHSVEVALGYEPKQPPEILYHGTSERFVEAIKASGLLKMQRQHVHLSIDIETAMTVGKRHGKPFVFGILANLMLKNSYELFLSENGVWLTEYVPVEYLCPI